MVDSQIGRRKINVADISDCRLDRFAVRFRRLPFTSGQSAALSSTQVSVTLTLPCPHLFRGGSFSRPPYPERPPSSSQAARRKRIGKRALCGTCFPASATIACCSRPACTPDDRAANASSRHAESARCATRRERRVLLVRPLGAGARTYLSTGSRRRRRQISLRPVAHFDISQSSSARRNDSGCSCIPAQAGIPRPLTPTRIVRTGCRSPTGENCF